MFEPKLLLEQARLTAEPELKTSKNGNQYLQFTLAANGSHKDKQTGQYVNDDPIFVNVTEFDTRMIATYRQTLHKGTAVRAEGRLKWRTATDRNGQPTVYFDYVFPTISLYLAKDKSTASAPQQDSYCNPAQQTNPNLGVDLWGANQTATDFGGFGNETEF